MELFIVSWFTPLLGESHHPSSYPRVRDRERIPKCPYLNVFFRSPHGIFLAELFFVRSEMFTSHPVRYIPDGPVVHSPGQLI